MHNALVVGPNEPRAFLRAKRAFVKPNGFFNILPIEEPTNSVPAGMMEDTAPRTPATMPDPTPASTLVDPSGEALKDAKAMAGLTPAQLKKLNALDKDYMVGNMSADDYRAARKKILSGDK